MVHKLKFKFDHVFDHVILKAIVEWVRRGYIDVGDRLCWWLGCHQHGSVVTNFFFIGLIWIHKMRTMKTKWMTKSSISYPVMKELFLVSLRLDTPKTILSRLFHNFVQPFPNGLKTIYSKITQSYLTNSDHSDQPISEIAEGHVLEVVVISVLLSEWPNGKLFWTMLF